MKFRGLIVATVVLLALMGALYWSGRQKSREAAKPSTDSPPAILKLDENTITKFELTKKDASPVLLSKSNSGSWQIIQPQQLNADQSAVSGALSTISSLNSQRLVEDKASDLKRYGLEQPSLEVDVTEKDNKTQKLLIGDDTPTGGAVYAMLEGDPRVFTMASYNKSSIDKSLNDLRDKQLLTVNADKISRIELIRKNEEIEFGRDKDEWQILKPKPLPADSFKVGELTRKLTEARMDASGLDTNAKEATAAFAGATPVATAKVTEQSGTQELQIRKTKDTYYAKSSLVEGVYKVDSDLGQALDKGVDDFLNKKLFDFGYSDPDKIEMHIGSKAYFLTRSGADWWSNGKKMDIESVEPLIGKLRDLSASKLVDTGFANPAIEITVTSDGGKRVENIAIAKSGAGYLAKRSDQPALYQFDASSIDDLADSIKPAAPPSK